MRCWGRGWGVLGGWDGGVVCGVVGGILFEYLDVRDEFLSASVIVEYDYIVIDNSHRQARRRLAIDKEKLNDHPNHSGSQHEKSIQHPEHAHQTPNNDRDTSEDLLSGRSNGREGDYECEEPRLDANHYTNQDYVDDEHADGDGAGGVEDCRCCCGWDQEGAEDYCEESQCGAGGKEGECGAEEGCESERGPQESSESERGGQEGGRVVAQVR